MIFFSEDFSRKTLALAHRLLDKRGRLLLGILCVVIPLLVLFGLQYWWLHQLEKASSLARKVTLENYLDIIGQKTEHFFTKRADAMLNIPPSLLLASEEDVTLFFKEWTPKHSGVQVVFLESFINNKMRGPVFFDPKKGELVNDIPEKVRSTVYQTSLNWKLFAHKVARVKSTRFTVEDKVDCSYIYKPVADENGALAGISGMVVDAREFSEQILPDLIGAILSQVPEREDLMVAVRDSTGAFVFTSGIAPQCDPGALPGTPTVGRLPFLFKDWEIGLRSSDHTFSYFARANFVFNMTLSILLGLAVVGGVFFALKTAANEMQLSSMKSDFVSNVSHELRTPIASIRAFGELLRAGRYKNDQKVREYGAYIETEGRRLTQLINNILDFSKIESGNKVYQFACEDLRDVVDLSLQAYRIRLMHHQIKIAIEGDDQDLPKVQVDSAAFQQVIANLVDNAIKYRGESQRIIVGFCQNGQEAGIYVKDFGIGIAPSEQGKIFDRFHRVNTGLVHDVKGAGLGLAIVKHVASAHKGRVAVESEVGAGSTFTIWLPIAGPPDAQGGMERG